MTQHRYVPEYGSREHNADRQAILEAEGLTPERREWHGEPPSPYTYNHNQRRALRKKAGLFAGGWRRYYGAAMISWAERMAIRSILKREAMLERLAALQAKGKPRD